MSKNKQILIIYTLLTLAILAVFWQVNNGEFIFFDDPDYVTENNHIQNGITLEGIRWAFTTGHASNWHPLTWISHMLDVQLFGLQPRWHHLTNLLFHIANTLLLFFVLHRMTKARWESAFVAALFAVHPLHVESVAWVSERKDVLSAFFWMLTMGAYCYYVERPKLQRYLIVVVFFALGLLAKPMLVTLPFVLLLLDFWPFQRFQQTSPDQNVRPAVIKPVSGEKQKGKARKKPAAEEVIAEKPVDVRYQRAMIRPLLWEKAPLFILTVLSSIVTYIVQQQGGMVKSFEMFPLSIRIANAFVSYVTYIETMIWPNNLAPIYPHLVLLLPTGQIVWAVLFLIAATIMVAWKSKKSPYLAVGWLWYVGTLVPVIGFVQVGLQARADRYTYIPLIGLFIMAAWGISELSKKWRYRKEVLAASSIAVLLCLCIVTSIQVRHWQSSIELLDHTLNVSHNNYIAYYNRGLAYQHHGNYQQAIGDYDKAIQINPKHAKAYYNRGGVYAILASYQQAIGDFDNAIAIYPKYEEAYFNRGSIYARLGNNQQAIGDYDKAIAINPKKAEPYINRGNSYARLGNYQQAIGDYDKAIEFNPKYADTYFIRGHAYSTLGNNRQALENVIAAARLGHNNAQSLLKSQGIGW